MPLTVFSNHRAPTPTHKTGFASTPAANAIASGSSSAQMPPPTPSSLTLTWNSRNGVTYDVEISNDLSDWTPLDQEITASDSETTQNFGVLPGQKKSFFRIIEVTP